VNGLSGNPTKADRNRACLLLFAALALMMLTPYLAPRLSPETALCVAALVSLLAIWVIRSGASWFDWFHSLSMFVAHFFLLFVADGIIILLGISHILTAVYGPAPDAVYDLMNRSTLYASGFLLTIYAGFLFRRQGAPPPIPSRAQRASQGELQFRQLRIAAWLSLGCSYVGCAILVAIFGGIGSVIGDPMAIIESRGAFWPFMLVWASLWSFGIFCASYVRERKKKHLVALLLTLPAMVFEFLTGGTKMAIILPVVCGLILSHYLVRRLTWKFMPKLAAFTLLIFVVGYSYRGPGGVREFGVSLAEYGERKASIFETFFGRFYGTDSFMVVLDATDEGYPLQWGKTMDDLLYFYVPRALWPGKPDSYALTFGKEFLGATSEAGQTFFTPTLPGELYLNFGLAGLAVGGLLTGMLLWEVYYKLVLRPNRSVKHLLVYAVVMPFVALLLSGPISTVMEYILLRCACFAVFYWFAGIAVRARTNGQYSRAILAP
jgi:oligosaccharide repeat unit polymerase